MEDENYSKLKEQLEDILVIEIPKVNYNDIIGLENAIQVIKEKLYISDIISQII
jgi:SpoVK/Ycf46/Vps4 family AAA+-type ATPase